MASLQQLTDQLVALSKKLEIVENKLVEANTRIINLESTSLSSGVG